MAVHRLVRSGGLRRFEHHHGQGWFDFVDLSSFRSTVNVGSFTVWLFKAGVKPSKTIGLGCVANVNGTTYGKQATWNTDGSVTLIGGVASSDIVQCFSKIIPVPDGVEFV